MNHYFCQACGSRAYFENHRCLSCGSELGFLPDALAISALEPAQEEFWRALHPAAEGRLYRKCRNYEQEAVCNWMVAHDEGSEYCLSCSLSRSIPDLAQNANWERWRKLELAKRRLVYSLLRLELPVVAKWKDPERGLAFDFLADPEPAYPDSYSVLTGHARGVVTINIREADDDVREQMRLKMGEMYRTVLGHFRHESGHYYWDLLVREHPEIGRFRALFGDERTDYAAALRRHYENGPPSDWQERCVTPYGASHPWEDWAETWAHYIHIMDTLETAGAYGMELDANGGRQRLRDPFQRPFEGIIEDWLALRFAINSLNRSMGFADPYPFILTDPVVAKLSFVHDWIKASAKAPSA